MNMTASIVASENIDIEEPARRLGEMLESAIRNGCLLDHRRWPSWLLGLSGGVTINGTLVSIEMSASEGLPHQRWFADPYTAILLIRWQRDGLVVQPGICPEILLAEWRGVKPGAVGEQLAKRSREAWAFRIPGLMLSYATGGVRATSVPTETWQRTIYGLHVSDRTQIHAKDLVQATSLNGMSQLNAALMSVQRILRASKSAGYEKGAGKARAAKSSAAAQLRSMAPMQRGPAACLRGWALYALTQEEGREGIGFAPSTVGRYLSCLASIFAEWASQTLTEASSADLDDHVQAKLMALPSEKLATTLKALSSFQRYANCVRPAADVLELTLEQWWPEERASPDLLLPQAYDRAVAALRRRGDEDAADILTLMFRAGLRGEEAAALRIGDVSIRGERVELIVEAHAWRSLKTKTSRRIIPLDVLLSSAEMAELRRRVNGRASAAPGRIEPWLFGHAWSLSPPSSHAITVRIVEAIRSASNSSRLTEHHPRHSFASYLLATLMLPQDVDKPDVPDRLAAVISRERFDKVADRLLGASRLGGGALHAVSQVMGHTGPGTTLLYYCHLLDLSLGLYCSRASSLPAANPAWLVRTLDVSSDARRKALCRAVAPVSLPPISVEHRRPSAQEILGSTPNINRKAADEQLAKAGIRRLSRPLIRLASAAMEPPRKLHGDSEGRAARIAKTKRPAPYIVPWQAITSVLLEREGRLDASIAQPWERAAGRVLPAGRTIRDVLDIDRQQPAVLEFIDQRLRLMRTPRRDEVAALQEVAFRWRRNTDIKLDRLRDGEALVRLLGIMGFTEREIMLSLSSQRGTGMDSSTIHAFLNDRRSAPQLAGRSGSRGSLIVRLTPSGLPQPINARRAARFALILLAVHLKAREER